jgi:hypothetical protein
MPKSEAAMVAAGNPVAEPARRPQDRNQMTALSRSFRHRKPTQVIDVRCSATLPARSAEDGRCQLFAGHDGPHALMFGRNGERLVRTWTTSATSSATSSAAAPVDTEALQRPWMFGFPVPAWFEADPASELTG